MVFTALELLRSHVMSLLFLIILQLFVEQRFALRIMAMGDSNTEGGPTPCAYRSELWRLLSNSLPTVAREELEFVGLLDSCGEIASVRLSQRLHSTYESSLATSLLNVMQRYNSLCRFRVTWHHA